MFHYGVQRRCVLPTILFAVIFGGQASASLGDRLPEFNACVSVRMVCAQSWFERTLTLLLGLHCDKLWHQWSAHT